MHFDWSNWNSLLPLGTTCQDLLGLDQVPEKHQKLMWYLNHATLKMDTLCTVEEKEVEMITSNFQPFTFKCAGLHELCLFEASIQIPVHMHVIEKTPAQFENVESNFDHFHLHSWIPSCHPSSIPIAFSFHGPSHGGDCSIFSKLCLSTVCMFCSLPSPTSDSASLLPFATPARSHASPSRLQAFHYDTLPPLCLQHPRHSWFGKKVMVCGKNPPGMGYGRYRYSNTDM